MSNNNRTRWISAIATASLLIAFSASAAFAKPCKPAKAMAGKLWKKYGELAMKYGCAKSTLDVKNSSALARAVSQCEKDPMAAAMIRGGLVRHFRNKAFWNLTKHPARLYFAAKEGSLLGTLGRTWINPEPHEKAKVEFVLKKRDGKGKASVTVCAYRPDGSVATLWDTTIDNGKENIGKTWTKSFGGVKGAIISATIDGKSVANKFAYSIRLRRPNQGKLTSAPSRRSSRSVAGFADLHAHQLGHLSFAGGWIYPSVEGRLRCTGDNHGLGLQGGAFRKRHPERATQEKWEHHLDTVHQQVHMKDLKRAVDGGLRLLVLPAVSNEFAAKLIVKGKNRDPDIPRDDMDSVRLQLRAAHALAAKYPWYEIAKNPFEAREIAGRGHLAVVLAVEVSHLMPKSQGAWQHQLDELYDLGVRSLELSHETDSDFSGRATHHGAFFKLSNFIKFPNVFNGNTKPKYQKNGFNARGLTPAGRQLVRDMARRNMVISIDHVSRIARREIYDIVTDRSHTIDVAAAQAHRRRAPPKLRHYPLFFSHSRYDALMPTHKFVKEILKGSKVENDIKGDGGNGSHGSAEYMATDYEALWVRETGGVFGLRTGPNVVMTYERSNVANTCHTSSRSFAQVYAYGLKRFGLAQSLGTDLNGFVAHIAPRFGRIGNTRTCSNILGQKSDDRNERAAPRVGTKFDTRGLAHVGYEPDLLKDLGNLGLNTKSINRSAETFLRMWERTYDGGRSALSARSYSKFMGVALASDVRAEDSKASKRTGASRNVEASPSAGSVRPSCPSGTRYEVRRGLTTRLQKDRCVRTTLEAVAPKCKLLVTDKKKNWTGPHQKRGTDECRSKKGKKPKGVKCKAGFKLEVRKGADRCVAKKPTYEAATCPNGFKYKQKKDGDLCVKKRK